MNNQTSSSQSSNTQTSNALDGLDPDQLLRDVTPTQDWSECQQPVPAAAQALIEAAQARINSVACFDFVPSNYLNAWYCLSRLASLCGQRDAQCDAQCEPQSPQTSDTWLNETPWANFARSVPSPACVRVCEWGSGWGVATGLAALSGFDASGIELDEALSVHSRGLLDQHGLKATIICGSYFEIDQLADIYYVYAWPSQRTRVIERFLQLAPPHALLLLCDGQDLLRVLTRR